MTTLDTSGVNVQDLRAKVQQMYDQVALEPDGDFHFEMGRPLAARLGYPPSALDAVPPAALESFAGVGWYFDLARLTLGETVVDLGSGSGTDAFVAARQVGGAGRVIGVDMTDAQLAKAERLRAEVGAANIEFRRGFLEELPVEDGSADCVVSNGVINLCPDKPAVFREIARVLRPGGRLALADIVTELQLSETITCNANLWAACIGGAAQQDRYREAMEGAGLRVTEFRDNPQYRFLSRSALGASEKYGVKSISLVAVRTK